MKRKRENVTENVTAKRYNITKHSYALLCCAATEQRKSDMKRNQKQSLVNRPG